MYKLFLKRVLDFFIVLTSIIILFPVYIILAILIRIKLGSPILFKQKRPGKNNKLFTLYKFRTMTNARDEEGNLLPDEQRFTKFGRVLRNSSLDELPQLFNILFGHMSIVGPRPKLVYDLVFFDEEALKRQSIRPGLTGLAQVNGRNSISWEDTFKYDLEYVENHNLFMDIKIIFKTVIQILKRKDIETDEEVTSKYYGEYLLKTKQITFDEYEANVRKMSEYDL